MPDETPPDRPAAGRPAPTGARPAPVPAAATGRRPGRAGRRAGHPGAAARTRRPRGSSARAARRSVERYWPTPAPRRPRRLLAACLGVGLLVASTSPRRRLGLQSGTVAAALTRSPVLAAARRDDRPRSRTGSRWRCLAVALAWVPAVRDAAPTVALSVVGALGLGAPRRR